MHKLLQIGLLSVLSACGGTESLETDIATMVMHYGSFFDGYKGYKIDLNQHRLIRLGDARKFEAAWVIESSSQQERMLIEMASMLTIEGKRSGQDRCFADGSEMALKITRKLGNEEYYVPTGSPYNCVVGAAYVPPKQLDDFVATFMSFFPLP